MENVTVTWSSNCSWLSNAGNSTISYVDENGDIFVRSQNKEITVEHDEHSKITLPANQWVMITRQREYDALAANRERQVAD